MKAIFVLAALALVGLGCFLETADAGMIVAHQQLGEEVSADYEQLVLRDDAYVFAELTEQVDALAAKPKAKKGKGKAKKAGKKGKKAGKKSKKAKKAGKKGKKDKKAGKKAKKAGKKGKKAGKKAKKAGKKGKKAGKKGKKAAKPKAAAAPNPNAPSCPPEPKEKREKCIGRQKQKLEAAYKASRAATSKAILDQSASIGMQATKMSDENFRMQRACQENPVGADCIKAQRMIGKLLKTITKETRTTLKTIKQQLKETKSLQQQTLDVRKNIRLKHDTPLDGSDKKKKEKKADKPAA